MHGSLKNKEDGSCIFLKFKVEGDRYECSIYDSRPALCRLYPFDFDRTGPNSIILKVIPCCRGLNNPDGEIVDERFITSHLLEALREAIDYFKRRTRKNDYGRVQGNQGENYSEQVQV